jgi:hypothetical protein
MRGPILENSFSRNAAFSRMALSLLTREREREREREFIGNYSITVLQGVTSCCGIGLNLIQKT